MFGSLTIVLPCFNEEANIESTVRSTWAWLSHNVADAHMIVVNDGSVDCSEDILERLCKEFPSLKVIHLPENQGYGRAIRAGCDAASTEWIAFMDSDGQFDPKDFNRLLIRSSMNAFVTGRRRKRADPLMRKIFGKVLGLMIFCCFGLWLRDVNCGMKLFHRDLWSRIRPTRGVEKLFNTELFIRMHEQHVSWAQVDVPHYPRTAGHPTGAKLSVIVLMFKELWALRFFDQSTEIASR